MGLVSSALAELAVDWPCVALRMTSAIASDTCIDIATDKKVIGRVFTSNIELFAS
jgi:hypothetical protein